MQDRNWYFQMLLTHPNQRLNPMSKHRVISLFVLLVSLAALPCLQAQMRSHDKAAKAAGLDVDSLTAMDAAMQKQIDDKHVAGVIGLIGRNGKIGYFEAFGHRNIKADKPMTRDALFRIYSMTKPMVAVTAMSLWEEGKFKLDDPISNFCPEWKNATVTEGGKKVPVNTPMTARHLMTHSSGLSYDRANVDVGPTTSLKTFSESLAKQPLKFQPGTDYQYGYSIDILGRYIEAIEGETLDVVMRERLFDKLSMDDTEFWIRKSDDLDRVALVYTKAQQNKLRSWNRSAELLKEPSRMMGGQGLVSTTADYAKFCQMFLNKGKLSGARILKAATVELMSQNHLKSIGKVYGLGGQVRPDGFYSWGGAAGTGFWIDPANNSYAVFMIQRWGYNPPTYGVFKRITAQAIGSNDK
jgi:CubicO group peptidase (beta-lactamase class C family)